jgi:hypothetical protein
VQYLGYVLSEDGISASPDKVKAVKDYLVPQNVKDVRAFLGLASFYRRLVPNFAVLAKPLTTLTHKDQKFEWGPSQKEAFQSMKEKCTTPVLAYANFKLPIIRPTPQTSLSAPFFASAKWDGTGNSFCEYAVQLSGASIFGFRG